MSAVKPSDQNASRSSFLPSPEGVVHDLSELSNPRLVFQPSQYSPLLDELQRTELTAYAGWRAAFPCQDPRPGRSLYAARSDEAAWPTAGVKMKGAAGIRRNQEGGWECLPPSPDKALGVAGEYHITLDEQLAVSSVRGRRRALNSLRLDAAHREYECQERLAAVGTGFRGLGHGALLNAKSGEPITDLNGDKIGVVFTEHDPRFRILGPQIDFLLTEDTGGMRVACPPGGSSARPETLIGEYLRLAEKIAEIKMRSAVEGGVLRQSGHVDNFLYDPSADELKMADTDSCLIVDQMRAGLRGPQLLRDIASDTLKMIATLSYCAYTPSFLRDLELRRCRPFERFFTGYFGEVVSERSLIGEWADRLQSLYLGFVDRRAARLGALAESIRNIAFESWGDGNPPLISVWNGEHIPCLPYCLEAAYELLLHSSLQNTGLKLPKIERDLLRAQLIEGVLYHYCEVEEESTRALLTVLLRRKEQGQGTGLD